MDKIALNETGRSLRERLNELVKIEEKELASIRQTRLIKKELEESEAEKLKQEESKRRLIEKENELSKRVEMAKKRVFQLEIEVSSWESVLQSRMEELRAATEKLNECHEKIWRGREEFSREVDSSGINFAFEVSRNRQDSAVAPMKDLDKVEDLKAALVKEEVREKELIQILEQIQEEISSSECSDLDIERLNENIRITLDRCAELEKRIGEKKRLISLKKEAEEMMFRSNPTRNQLFSMVNVKDVARNIRRSN